MRGYYVSFIMFLGFVAFFLPTLSLPSECSIRDSNKIGIIEPNSALLMICAYLYGLMDGTLNTQLCAMIGIIYPNEKESAGVFVLWNFSQCIFCAAGLFYSPYIELKYQTFINSIGLIISLVTFLKLDMMIIKKIN